MSEQRISKQITGLQWIRLLVLERHRESNDIPTWLALEWLDDAIKRSTPETGAKRQRYFVTGRFVPISENGVMQVGLDVYPESTHEVEIVDASAPETGDDYQGIVEWQDIKTGKTGRKCNVCGTELGPLRCTCLTHEQVKACQKNCDMPIARGAKKTNAPHGDMYHVHMSGICVPGCPKCAAEKEGAAHEP